MEAGRASTYLCIYVCEGHKKDVVVVVVILVVVVVVVVVVFMIQNLPWPGIMQQQL